MVRKKETKNVRSQATPPPDEQEVQELINYGGGDVALPYSLMEKVRRNFPLIKKFSDENGELRGQIPSELRESGRVKYYYVSDDIKGKDLLKLQALLSGGPSSQDTIDVSIDQQTVTIVATDEGVTAEGNQVSLTLPAGSLSGEDNTRLTRVPEQFAEWQKPCTIMGNYPLISSSFLGEWPLCTSVQSVPDSRGEGVLSRCTRQADERTESDDDVL
jgi:hypothetical protein